MMTKQALGFAVGLVLLPATGLSVGFRVFDQDAFATARGNAYVATADNPSAVYYNPAGISQLEGLNLRAGLYGLYIKDDYQTSSGVRYENESTINVLPQVYGTWGIPNTPLTVGLGLYCPYGLSMEWPIGVPFQATEGRRGDMAYLTLEPVLSWQICRTLSLGAGPTFNYSEATLARQLSPTAEFKFKGSDFAVGATVGLLWKPHEKHAFGITYRSPTTMNYDGTTSLMGFSAPSQASDFRFPQSITAGWSFRPTPVGTWNSTRTGRIGPISER